MFKRVEAKRRPHTNSAGPVSIASVQLDPKHKHPTTRMYLKDAMVAGWLGADVAGPVGLQVFVGEGKEAGKLLFKLADFTNTSADINLRRHNRTEWAMQGKVLPSIPEARGREAMEWALGHGGLLVTLPQAYAEALVAEEIAL